MDSPHRSPGLPRDLHVTRHVWRDSTPGDALAPPAGSTEATPRQADTGGLHDPGPLHVAWQSRWQLALLAIAVGLTTFVLSAHAQPVFIAETTLAFPAPGTVFGLAGGDAERARSLRTETSRITSLALMKRAAARVDGALRPRALMRQVEAIPSGDADIITVRATASTGEKAADIADAVAVAYQDHVDERLLRLTDTLKARVRTLRKRLVKQQDQLGGLLSGSATDTADPDATPVAGNDAAAAAARLKLEATAAQLAEIQQQLDQAQADGAGAGTVQVLVPAAVPTAPERPRPARNAATAVILTVLGLVTVRWWRAEPLPRTLQSAEAAAALLDAPVIAEVPHLEQHGNRTPIITDRSRDVIDVHRMVTAGDTLRGSVLLTTADANEACSVLARNLAVLLARDGQRALVIADGRHRYTDAAGDGPGFVDLSSGRARPVDTIRIAKADGDTRIGVVPWGSDPEAPLPHPGADVAGALHVLTEMADVVLVEGQCLTSSPDTLTWATHVDGILLVVTLGTPLAQLRRLRTRLDQLDRPILGIVVRQAPARRWRRPSQRVHTRPLDWATEPAAATGTTR